MITETTELEILIEGRIIDSNFDAFCQNLKEQIKSLRFELVTDADFEKAAKDVKALKSARESLKKAKDRALEQAAEVQKLFADIDDVSDEVKVVESDLNRQIKDRKITRKREIIDEAAERIICDMSSVYRTQIESALKGKSSFEIMEVAANEFVDRINDNLSTNDSYIEEFIETNGKALIPDKKTLLQMERDALVRELDLRIERAKLEAERKQLEKEQLETRKAEARRLVEAKKLEEQKRIEAEREKAESEKLQAEIVKAEFGKPAAPQPVPVNTEKELQNETEEAYHLTAKGELMTYCADVKEAFAQLKPIREKLQHERSLLAVQRFSVKVNSAYFELEKEAQK